jgi:hypothetical protein
VKLLAGAAALGLLFVIVGAFTALRGHGPPGFPESSYATRADAEGASALRPGAWLPAQIPAGATQLHESHNPATHQTWGSFRLAAGSEGWRPLLSPKESEQPGELMLLGAPKNVEWWPPFLRARTSSADLEAQGFRFYVVEKGEKSPLVFAVRGLEVFFWRLARQ